MRLNHFYSDKIDHNINLQCGNKTAIQIIFKYVCLANLQYPSTCTNQFEYSCKSELYSRNKHVPSYNSVCSITYKLKLKFYELISNKNARMKCTNRSTGEKNFNEKQIRKS